MGPIQKGLLRRGDLVLKGFFPPACFGCTTPLSWEKRGADPSFFCKDCRSSLLPLVSPICPACGIPHTTGQKDYLCRHCLKSPPSFSKARSAFRFEGSLMDMVHGFKYNGRVFLARPFGAFLDSAFQEHWEDLPDRVVVVPMRKEKRIRRGMNPAEVLARSWFDRRRKRGVPLPVLDTTTLVRTRKTPSQTGLSRRQRRANVRNSFGCTRRLPGDTVLLVDDVMTTGATADACAQKLVAAGATSVSVLTLARTPFVP